MLGLVDDAFDFFGVVSHFVLILFSKLFHDLGLFKTCYFTTQSYHLGGCDVRREHLLQSCLVVFCEHLHGVDTFSSDVLRHGLFHSDHFRLDVGGSHGSHAIGCTWIKFGEGNVIIRLGLGFGFLRVKLREGGVIHDVGHFRTQLFFRFLSCVGNTSLGGDGDEFIFFVKAALTSPNLQVHLLYGDTFFQCEVQFTFQNMMGLKVLE